MAPFTTPEQIFGPCGRILPLGYGFKVGYWSYYGFHPRAVGVTRADALAKAAAARAPDDPTPTDQSWVPGSYTHPFTPYRKVSQ